MMREGALSVKWPLGGFAAPKLGGVPAAGGSDPGKARFRAGIDENDPVALLVEAGLEQEGRVDDQGARARRCGGEEGLARPCDPGVDQGFQARTLGRLLEDDGGDRTAVDRRRHAVRLGVARVAVTHAVAPPGHELATDLGVVVGLTCKVVAVGDDAALGGKGAGHGGLAGTDAAGEAEDGRGASGQQVCRSVSALQAGNFRPRFTLRPWLASLSRSPALGRELSNHLVNEPLQRTGRSVRIDVVII